jgi:hypothetical protein
MKNIHILPTDKYSPLVYSTNKYGGLFLSKHYSPMKEMGDSYQNIYITNDEFIEEGDFGLNLSTKNIVQYDGIKGLDSYYKKIILTTDQDLIKDGVQAIDEEFLEWFVKNPSCEEVEVELQYQYHSSKEFYHDAHYVNCTEEQYESIKKEIPTCPLRILYKIIIPQEEPKEEVHGVSRQTFKIVLNKEWFPRQETLEEAAERYARKQCDDMYDNEGLTGASWGWETSLDFKAGAEWQEQMMYSEEEVLNFGKLVLDTFHSEGRTHSGNPRLARIKYQKWFEQFKKK